MLNLYYIYVVKHNLGKLFVPLQSYKKRTNINLKPVPKMTETQKLKIMKEMKNEIQMLQYRIKRYHDMRNGAMCQALNGKLQKLLAKQQAAL